MSASGIFSTLGIAAESTWGTYAAPTAFVTYNSNTLMSKKTPLQGQALHGGIYNLASRRSIGKWSAGGGVDFDLYDRGMGLWFKQMLGAGTSALKSPSTTVYHQIFTPADTTGESFTLQVGTPSTNNTTIVPANFLGSKITDWTISIKAGELAGFNVTLDSSKMETTDSYVSPSYTLGNIFVAAECSLLFGGTASTSSGFTSISGGTAVPLTRSVTIKGTNAVDTARYVLGSDYKVEQIINGFRVVSIEAELDFNGLSQCWNLYQPDTQFAVQFNFLGTTELDTPNSLFGEVNMVMPACFFDEDSFPVPGPQVVSEKVKINVLDDGTNNPMQIDTLTLDSTIV
jgi:hypothetical protein